MELELLTTGEAAEELDLSDTYVAMLGDAGVLPVKFRTRRRGDRFFDPDDVAVYKKLLEERRRLGPRRGRPRKKDRDRQLAFQDDAAATSEPATVNEQEEVRSA